MLKRMVFSLTAVCFMALHGGDIKNELDFSYQYYDDNNGVTVREPFLKAAHQLGENTVVDVQFLLDAITGASRNGYNPILVPDNSFQAAQDSGIPAEAVSGASPRHVDLLYRQELARWDSIAVTGSNALSADAVTSASIRENRFQLGGGVTQRMGTATLGLKAAGSMENDYQSISIGAEAGRSFNAENTDVHISYMHFFDEYNPRKLNNEEQSAGTLSPLNPWAAYRPEERGGAKSTENLTIALTQTLSHTTQAMVSYGLISSSGFLDRPYYFVFADGTPYRESLPDSKSSHAGVLQLRQFYPSIVHEGSVQLEYRRYWDTWGISSNTYAASLYQYILKQMYVQLKYRLYSQTGADFYRDLYHQRHVDPGSPAFLPYITSDSRLSPFDSHMLQGTVVVLLNRFLSAAPGNQRLMLFPTRLTFTAEKYIRGTHESAAVRRYRYETYGKEGLQSWILRGGVTISY